MHSLKPKNSSGYDGITGTNLKACMNHEISLAQLHSNGIQGVSKYWFRSYLSNRRQS